uniref:Uncharacterized protein n=1 Tax=Hordeum vulgare subsp. vulgare TaxID=112509 RepID=A0A8I6XLA5_HORVV
MTSWNNEETSFDEDCEAINMDMGIFLQEEPCTIVETENGVNCGVVEWVDGPWPPVLHICLSKLWVMFHEWSYGRTLDKEQFEKQLAKLKAENDKLSMEYIKLVEDVSKMFDWQDGMVDKKVYQKQVEEEDFVKKKKEVEEKARNTRKAMKDVEVDRDLLKKEKEKLEQVVVEMLKDGYVSKEKLEQIKDILES